MKTPGGKPKQKSLKTLQASLLSKAKELKYNLDTRTSGIKARNKKVVSKTFHKAGIVVPVDANDVGYRPLTVTDGEWIILKLVPKIPNVSCRQSVEQLSADSYLSGSQQTLNSQLSNG